MPNKDSNIDVVESIDRVKTNTYPIEISDQQNSQNTLDASSSSSQISAKKSDLPSSAQNNSIQHNTVPINKNTTPIINKFIQSSRSALNRINITKRKQPVSSREILRELPETPSYIPGAVTAKKQQAATTEPRVAIPST